MARSCTTISLKGSELFRIPSLLSSEHLRSPSFRGTSRFQVLGFPGFMVYVAADCSAECSNCRCVIAELKKLGEAYSGSALAARRLDLIKYGSNPLLVSRIVCCYIQGLGFGRRSRGANRDDTSVIEMYGQFASSLNGICAVFFRFRQGVYLAPGVHFTSNTRVVTISLFSTRCRSSLNSRRCSNYNTFFIVYFKALDNTLLISFICSSVY